MGPKTVRSAKEAVDRMAQTEAMVRTFKRHAREQAQSLAQRDVSALVERHGVAGVLFGMLDHLETVARKFERTGHDLTAKDVRVTARYVKYAAHEIERLYR